MNLLDSADPTSMVSNLEKDASSDPHLPIIKFITASTSSDSIPHFTRHPTASESFHFPKGSLSTAGTNSPYLSPSREASAENNAPSSSRSAAPNSVGSSSSTTRLDTSADTISPDGWTGTASSSKAPRLPSQDTRTLETGAESATNTHTAKSTGGISMLAALTKSRGTTLVVFLAAAMAGFV